MFWLSFMFCIRVSDLEDHILFVKGVIHPLRIKTIVKHLLSQIKVF